MSAFSQALPQSTVSTSSEAQLQSTVSIIRPIIFIGYCVYIQASIAKSRVSTLSQALSQSAVLTFSQPARQATTYVSTLNPP